MSMRAVSRLADRSYVPKDSHGRGCCDHGAIGPAQTGSPNVFVNSRPVLRVGDTGVHSKCCGDNTWEAVQGAQRVIVNGRRVHRLGDEDRHCGGMGYMVDGSPDVVAGD